jgi:predicted nucleotidyltransferase
MRHTTTEIARKIRPVAERYGIPEVYVFGSYARGNTTESSDIDILIKRSGSNIRSAFDLGEFFNDLRSVFGQKVDLVTLESLNTNDTRKSRRRFAENVDSEKVLIYERR